MDKGINGVTALGFGLEEYIKMFDLTDIELNMNILDCRAGASCFAAQMHEQSQVVVACDPLYRSEFDQIKHLVNAAKDSIQNSFATSAQEFSILPEKAKEFMHQAETGIEIFFNDFPEGQKAGRYTGDSLPSLSFDDEQFQLALVCHYLFTFSEQMSVEDHLNAIKELVRVSNEVRIFPLVTYGGQLSPYVGEVVAMLQNLSYGVEIRGVDYALQNQGNAMLRVWAESCSVDAHKTNQ
tara:strand:- start:120197 stop:120910 length:714 start_codon:yes stop_codon:yes gene_type:complete